VVHGEKEGSISDNLLASADFFKPPICAKALFFVPIMSCAPERGSQNEHGGTAPWIQGQRPGRALRPM